MRTATPWVTGNWKMHHTRADLQAFLAQSAPARTRILAASSVRELLFLPATLLETAQRWKAQQPDGAPFIEFGAQNVHGAEKGAFTGELSAAHLKDLGVHWSLVGHSERRHVFGESQNIIDARVTGALSQGISIVYCVGETRAEREAGKLSQVLQQQLRAWSQWQEVLREARCQLLIAYEPVWAIGTGLTATTAQAQEAHALIREGLKSGGAPASETPAILYGGSVTPINARELLGASGVDGVLVGGASLQASSWAEILTSATP